jgi:hypothetical protein
MLLMLSTSFTTRRTPMDLKSYRAQLEEAACAAQQPRLDLPTPPTLPDVALYRQLVKSALLRGKHLPTLPADPVEKRTRLLEAYTDDLVMASDWIQAATAFATARGGKGGQRLIVELRHHQGLLDRLRDQFNDETAPALAEDWAALFLHVQDSVERVRWACYRPARRHK